MDKVLMNSSEQTNLILAKISELKVMQKIYEAKELFLWTLLLTEINAKQNSGLLFNWIEHNSALIVDDFSLAECNEFSIFVRLKSFH